LAEEIGLKKVNSERVNIRRVIPYFEREAIREANALA
jgi:hypothetical protein